jgi:hypothetical protein
VLLPICQRVPDHGPAEQMGSPGFGRTTAKI